MGETLNLGVDIVLSLDNVAQIVFVLLFFGHVFLLAHDGQAFFFMSIFLIYMVSLECMFDCLEGGPVEKREMRGKGGRMGRREEKCSKPMLQSLWVRRMKEGGKGRKDETRTWMDSVRGGRAKWQTFIRWPISDIRYAVINSKYRRNQCGGMATAAHWAIQV